MTYSSHIFSFLLFFWCVFWGEGSGDVVSYQLPKGGFED